MTLSVLRNVMRLLLALFIITLSYWVNFSLPAEANITGIVLFQILPLLLIAPLFIQCRSPHMHIALPIIMIYMCFTAPNLFLEGTAQAIALVELALNLALSCTIMWYLLKASKLRRLQYQILSNEGTSN